MPALRPYSASPARALLQVAVDVLVVGWCWFWVKLAMTVHDAVTAAGAVGYQVRDGATGLRTNLDDAARQTRGLPLVGDAVGDAL